MPLRTLLRLPVAAATALSLCASAAPATAAPVVDQSYDFTYGQTTGILPVLGLLNGGWGQIFSAGLDTLDWAAAGLIGVPNSASNVPLAVARIWDASNVDANGAITLAATPLGVSEPSVIAASVHDTYALDDAVPMTAFTFATPITLTVGNRYLLDIVLENVEDSNNAVWRFGQQSSPGLAGYAGGDIGWFDTDDGKVDVLAGLDFAFATGRLAGDDDAPSDPAPIPAPPTLALALLGLAALRGLRRRRRPDAAAGTFGF